MRLGLLIIIAAVLMPSGLNAETVENVFEKYGVRIYINYNNEANIFAGTDLNYQIDIPEGTVFTGLMIFENVKINAADNLESSRLPVSGPYTLRSSVKLKPARYGDLKIQDLEFKFRNSNGFFDITVDTLRLKVASMLNQESRLMDLSVPQFSGKNSLLLVIILVTAALILSAAGFLFVMTRRKNTKTDPKKEFWETWENLHEIRDKKKEFYITLTNSIKKYAGFLSGSNMEPFSHEKFINWIFININLNNQLQHDFIKSYSEWEKIKFRKNYISDVSWRDDLKMIKNIFIRIEVKFQEKKK